MRSEERGAEAQALTRCESHLIDPRSVPSDAPVQSINLSLVLPRRRPLIAALVLVRLALEHARELREALLRSNFRVLPLRVLDEVLRLRRDHERLAAALADVRRICPPPASRGTPCSSRCAAPAASLRSFSFFLSWICFLFIAAGARAKRGSGGRRRGRMPRAAAKERARGGERGKGRETFRRRRAATSTSSAASKPRCPDVKNPRTGCASRDGRSRERFRARPYGQTVSSRDGSSRIRLIGRGSPARLHLRRRAALKFSLGTRPRSLSSPAVRPHTRPRGSVAATSAADAPGTRARSDARARSLDEGPRRRSRVALGKSSGQASRPRASR